jgi:glycosyltransferase involved in cell wall biosynthesis
MKVLHLDSGMDWRGGQQQVYFLATGLRKLGVEQHLVLRKGGELTARVRRTELPVSALPLSSELAPISFFQLAKIVRRFNPDIIHTHDSRTLGLAAVLKSFGDKWKLLAARRVPFRIGKNPFWRFKYRRNVDKIIAVSRFVRDLLIEEGINPGSVEVIYDGYDPNPVEAQFDRATARQHLDVGMDEFAIGCVGRFSLEKGHEFLIRGFQGIKDVDSQARLILVGDGPLRDHYQRLIHELQLERKVLLPGFVSNLSQILPALDLFVFPSLEEGLGSTLLLAMAHQIPVCASRTGGIPELVIEGQTGFLFPPGNSQALAETLIRAWQDRALARSLARQAFLRIKTDFPIERMIAETYKIYTNVLRRENR